MDFKLKPSEVADNIGACLASGLVPYLRSSPGIGKSTIIAQLAEEKNLEFIDIRLAQCTPEDLQGFPMRDGNKATFVPFDMFPIEGDEIPFATELNKDGERVVKTNKAGEKIRRNGWLLHLDELSSANKAVQAAAYKLILDRMVGSYNLHPNVYMVACGNLITDRAVVHKMSTALMSRLIHFELNVDAKGWRDWAIEADLDYRVIAFIGFKPEKLMDFDPEKTDNTFPCPRTWHFVSQLIEDIEEISDVKHMPLLAGAVGAAAAAEFISFCQVEADLPDLDLILDPDKGGKIPVPKEVGAKYAMICMMGAKLRSEEVMLAVPYVENFTADLQIIFCYMITRRFPTLDVTNPDFQKYSIDIARRANTFS